MPRVSLTELEKTILLVFLVNSKGKIEKFVKPIVVIQKFPVRQRKAVGRFLLRLARKNLLEKKGTNYRLTKDGARTAANLLRTGVSLWSIRSEEKVEREVKKEKFPEIPEAVDTEGSVEK
jgi:predicted transcriptional regulator